MPVKGVVEKVDATEAAAGKLRHQPSCILPDQQAVHLAATLTRQFQGFARQFVGDRVDISVVLLEQDQYPFPSPRVLLRPLAPDGQGPLGAAPHAFAAEGAPLPCRWLPILHGHTAKGTETGTDAASGAKTGVGQQFRHQGDTSFSSFAAFGR